MKKIIIISILSIIIIVLNGCSSSKYPKLPKAPIAFFVGEYIDQTDDNASYSTIGYQGRTYILYGTIDNVLNIQDIDDCLGYFVQEGKEDKNRRVYTLVADKENNFLVDIYVDDSIMSQPNFWRAVDTKNNDIIIPNYIKSLKYLFWE